MSTSVATDSYQAAKLLKIQDAPSPLDALKFNEANWAYLTDTNGNSYYDTINFSTTILKQQLVDYHSAFLAIPITVTRAKLAATQVGTPVDFVNTRAPGKEYAPENYVSGLQTDEALICFRDSILNLIRGLQIQTDNGQTIVNENGYLDFINNLRLKIEKNVDWSQSMSSLLHMSLDTSIVQGKHGGFHNNMVSQFLPNALAKGTSRNTEPNYDESKDEYSFTSNSSIGQTTVSSTITTNPSYAVPNPCFNKGVWDRVQIFHNSSKFTGKKNSAQSGTNGERGTYDLVVKIPLRLIHDFFEQMDFPIINLGFNFTFYLRQPHTNDVTQFAPPDRNIPPLMVASQWSYDGSLPSIGTGGYPAIAYGKSVQNSGYGTGCRLYFRSIKLDPSNNQLLYAALGSQGGLKKSFKFISTDYFTPSEGLTPSTTEKTYLISNSIVWPQRVWALLYTADILGNDSVSSAKSISGALGGGYQTDGVFGPQCSLQTVQGWMKNANILINNNPYFKSDLTTVDDFWNQLKDQFPPSGASLISYDSFARLFRYHCFDISRLSDRLPSKTEPVSLQLKFDRADYNADTPDGFKAGRCDLIVLIERVNQVDMSFSNSDVQIVVGNITA